MNSHPTSRVLKLFAWAGLALALSLVPARAATPITKTHFSLTFPDGWVTPPYVPTTDSSIYIGDTANSAVVIGGFQGNGGAMGVATWRKIWEQVYAQEFAISDSGTKNIGSHSFFWTDWVDTTSEDTGADLTHGRFYVTTQGNALFYVWVAYSAGDQASAVADVEAALASLQFMGVTNVRPLARVRLDYRPDARDALGRSRAPVTYRLPLTPFFERRR